MISNELKEKEARAIKFLQAMERPEGYHLAFSGGKDSVVIKHLADKAGIKYRAVYRVTSVDPPELVRFIKEEYPEVERETPRYDDGTPITMWNLIVKKGGASYTACALLLRVSQGIRWGRADDHHRRAVGRVNQQEKESRHSHFSR